MKGTEENSPRPICEVCEQPTVRVTAVAGKGVYECKTLGCPNMFRKGYTRPSAQTQDDADA